MEWFISHQSALEFWRQASAESVLANKKVRIKRLPSKPPDARKLHKENPWGLLAPLHILVGSSNARKATQNLRCHIVSREFPHGSFVQASPGLIASSPELCFLQMADELSLPELIALGYELCGSYRLDNEGESERGFRDDAPLTSVAQLKAYLIRSTGFKGHKKALRAVRFIAEGSASPMETALCMLLTLPYLLGGYGFPLPQLNYPVDARSGTEKARGKHPYRCDLYWAEERVDVEYNSDAYHANPERIARDAMRQNALSSVGVTVVTVTRRQIVDTARLREFAEGLGKLLHKRLQCPLPEFKARHTVLRRQILPRKNIDRW